MLQKKVLNLIHTNRYKGNLSIFSDPYYFKENLLTNQ